jgi:Flp pilus assembly protein TadB
MESAGILLLYVLMFVGALLVFDGLIQLFFGSDKEDAERAVNKRLRLLSSGMDPEEVLLLLRRQRRRSAVDRVPVLRHWPSLLNQAGFTVDPMRGVYGMAAATLAVVLVLQMLNTPWLVALALGAALGSGRPGPGPGDHAQSPPRQHAASDAGGDRHDGPQPALGPSPERLDPGHRA